MLLILRLIAVFLVACLVTGTASANWRSSGRCDSDSLSRMYHVSDEARPGFNAGAIAGVNRSIVFREGTARLRGGRSYCGTPLHRSSSQTEVITETRNNNPGAPHGDHMSLVGLFTDARACDYVVVTVYPGSLRERVDVHCFCRSEDCSQ